MPMMTDVGRTALMAGAALFMLSAAPALAQQDPPAPAAIDNPPPADGPLAGRPETPGAQRLAPLSSPPFATEEADLPLAKIVVPDGFEVEVYAAGIKDARTVRVGENAVFVSNWQGNKIWVITEENGERTAEVLYDGLDWPNGIALHDGTLYVAEHKTISKVDAIESHLKDPPPLETIYDDLGDPRPHGWRFLDVGPDDKLYVSNSAPCNICMLDEGFGEIRKINLDGSGAEPVLRGMRNTVGFDFHPGNGHLYFTDNNRDWLSEDLPNGELNRMTEPGKQHFGFPFCHQGDLADPEFGWGYDCADFEPPVAKLGPHVAPLGMRFYTGSSFPQKYQGAIFVARHGPWNRTKKIGADILAVFLDENGDVTGMEPFLSGLIENNEYIGRPVDVEQMADGSLLVTDDWNGAVYRVSYTGD
ncbi:PQQ-dependent sugar dehydrogenase [Acuticoccus sp. I52.16.1]|uniref:PQQ-dependent sugar dehydrogenase n=1 Tax=Acuticoccus sp. I52.16.1 TaxID=2928472 RepID=UPI001FCFA195|nr:PQQ-dependent sugar dehydrogenase [Acuticoccus sp. I52.16.1]UOM36287.1 PQQ-dependent sugar dehydrogenase [Acuticoccus sp. I52.16.1]